MQRDHTEKCSTSETLKYVWRYSHCTFVVSRFNVNFSREINTANNKMENINRIIILSLRWKENGLTENVRRYGRVGGG